MVDYPYPAMERAMKIQEVILKAMSKQITWIDAAEIIGISCRQMRRWRQRYQKFGYDGLFDRRNRRPSPKRVPLELAEKVLSLYREHYYDFNVKHFHEKLVQVHQIRLSYQWVKIALQTAGLVAKAKPKGKHRIRRPRRPLPGMMLHLDGSTHAWLPNQTHDLLVISDDATNQIYDARLVPQEDTLGCLQLLKNVVAQRGVFCALYTDRGSHFFLTPQAGQEVDPHRLTQIGRALKELHIQPIPAYSPQARGRSERLFGTLQGRWPAELRLAKIHTLDSANLFIRHKLIPDYNRRFKVKPTQQGTAFIPVHRVDLERIFCLKHERTIANDNTLSYGNRILQIHPSPVRISFAKCRVTVCEHLDGSFTVLYGPHCLGRFNNDGTPISQPFKLRKAA
jgi:transposase